MILKEWFILSSPAKAVEKSERFTSVSCRYQKKMRIQASKIDLAEKEKQITDE